MSVHKWSDLRSKLSPERRERIRKGVELELAAAKKWTARLYQKIKFIFRVFRTFLGKRS